MKPEKMKMTIMWYCFFLLCLPEKENAADSFGKGECD